MLIRCMSAKYLDTQLYVVVIYKNVIIQLHFMEKLSLHQLWITETPFVPLSQKEPNLIQRTVLKWQHLDTLASGVILYIVRT